MKNSYRISYLLSLVFFAVVFLSAPQCADAQKNEPSSPDLRKWSINLYGGSFLARTDMDITPFTGYAGTPTRHFNPSFGADIEYMATPGFGLRVRYDYSMIENDKDADSFELTMQAVTAGIRFYPLNALRSGDRSPWLNPYISADIGQAFGDWSGIDGVADDDSRDATYGFGFGTKVRLGSRIDWILDYQYRYFDPEVAIDGGAGTGDTFESDRLAGISTGFSVKFGSSDRNHARWYSPSYESRQWQTGMEPRMNEQETTQEDVITTMDQQNATIESILSDLEGKADQSQLQLLIDDLAELQVDLDGLSATLDDFSTTLDHELSRIDDIHNAAGLAYLTTGMPEGYYYVQIYAAWNKRLVQRALMQTRETLSDEGINVNELAFYVFQVPGGLFTAQIGQFEDKTDANGVLEAALDLFDDAFVRTH